jgi:hypothetical protein
LEVDTQYASCNVALKFAYFSLHAPSSHIATGMGLSGRGGLVALRISTLPLVYDRAALACHAIGDFRTFARLSGGSQGGLGVVVEREDAGSVRVGGVEAQEDGVGLFHLVPFKPSVECCLFETPRTAHSPAWYRALSGKSLDFPQTYAKIAGGLLCIENIGEDFRFDRTWNISLEIYSFNIMSAAAFSIGFSRCASHVYFPPS